MNNSKLTTAISNWVFGDGDSFRVAETNRFLKMINVTRTVGDDYTPPVMNHVVNELLEISFKRTMTTNKEKLISQKKFNLWTTTNSTLERTPGSYESIECAELYLGLKRLFLIEPHIPCHHFLTHLFFDLIMLFLSSSNGLSVKKNISPGLNDLQFTEDGQVKGSAIMFCLDPKGQFTWRVIGGVYDSLLLESPIP